MTTAKLKVGAKYFALGKAKPKSGPIDGDFDSSDLVEAEWFEVFFPKEGFPSKEEYINKIRECGDLKNVEKSLYGKSGNVVKYYKFHNKSRVVINSKEQFDDLLENVTGADSDARLHIKLIPEKALWKIGPGGKLSITGAGEVNKGNPSNKEMKNSLLIDQKVKDIKSSLVKDEKIEDCKVYRSGDQIFIYCKCGKSIKTRSDRGAKSCVTRFMYEHFTPKHVVEGDSDDSEKAEEEVLDRPSKSRKIMRVRKKAASEGKGTDDESDSDSNKAEEDVDRPSKSRKIMRLRKKGGSKGKGTDEESESDSDNVEEEENMSSNGRKNMQVRKNGSSKGKDTDEQESEGAKVKSEKYQPMKWLQQVLKLGI